MKALTDRFWGKVAIGDPAECWLWTGAITDAGYGHLGRGGRAEGNVLAHRLAYEIQAGPIPDGLQIDHLCRVRLCVNPAHLEPVTPGVNTERGLVGYALRTMCVAGLHDITDPANQYMAPSGERTCAPCHLAGSRNQHAALRDAANHLGLTIREYTRRHGYSARTAAAILEGGA